MWSYIKRQQERERDRDRVTKLVSLRATAQRGLSQQDFVNAGAAINIRPHLLHAFYAVESSGSGFDQNGRLKILYEPHVVSRNTGRRLDGMRFPWKWKGQDIHVQLSYKKWVDIRKVPRDAWHPYRESDTGRWEMLATTYELEENAIMGASYGGFQILGENAKKLGYIDTLDMIYSLYEGEFAHLDAAIRYLRMFNVLDALRAGDFATVEKAWNGPSAGGAFADKFAANAANLSKAYA